MQFLKNILTQLISIINKNDVKEEVNVTSQNEIKDIPNVTELTMTENSDEDIVMGYNFGKRSRSRLDTCHPDMIAICEEVIKIYDFSVLEGLRTLEKQQEYFETGRSKLDGVNKKSKHQGVEIDGKLVSMAVDVMPYAKGTNAFSGKEKDNRRFYFMMGIFEAVANKLLEEGKIHHSIRFGLDWDGDHIYDDQNFDDLPHLELVNVKKS
jgi:peptidoglycan L-alanyl-D-glutamate endopeptidase CwlK